MRARALAAVLVVVLLAWGEVALASPEKCKAAIIKAGAAFVQGRAKALLACEQAKLGGKLAASTVCATEIKTSAKLAKVRAALTATIAKACGGDDKSCGGTDDEELAAIGWNISACPDFETGDCTNPITSCADIPTCLACVNEGAVDQAIGLTFGDLVQTDPKSKDKAVKALRKCQAALGKASAVFLAAKSKALAACWTRVNKSGTGTCPDAKASAAIANAQAKQIATVTKACTGVDKEPGTADDPTPATIGFPATCFEVTPLAGAGCTGSVDTLAQLVGCVDCSTRFTVDCADRVAVPAFVPEYPDACNPPTIIRRECPAQRVVHIVGGNGSLGWFTQVWPLPAVVGASPFNPSYSLDDPANFELVPGTGASHPLYARLIGARHVLEGLGESPEPTVFVASTNQTHDEAPKTTLLDTGVEVVAAGAALQAPLARGLVAISIDPLSPLPFGPAPGAPTVARVVDVAAAIQALKAVTPISPAVEQDLTPSSAQLASYGVTGATPALVAALARNLAFAANAFRLGLVGTVVMRGFNNDPHGAFDSGDATPRAIDLTNLLDGFYADLAAHHEPTCGVDGRAPSLADNTVLAVSGDTYKTPFNRFGWGDGTPGNSNLLYVRSNGFLKPGWFGSITTAAVPNARIDFDPTTGELAPVPSPNPTPATRAAQLGLLYAISRGNAAAVAQVSAAPYQGVIAPTP